MICNNEVRDEICSDLNNNEFRRESGEKCDNHHAAIAMKTCCLIVP